MTTGPISNPGGSPYGAVSLGEPAATSDGELLTRFIARRDHTAFETLVRRHGPMVLGVCRRVLRNAHDAEDAFQAAFFVLARKADSVVPPERVGNFLYGVAYRCALEAKTAIARRRAREGQAAMATRGTPEDEVRDLREALDRELSRLPEKYRLPVVLCELEGKSRKEVAGELGWPEGTVAGRLARARALLAKRLSREGVMVSSVSLGALLAREAALSALPAPLVTAALKAAAAAAGQAAAGVVSAQVGSLAHGAMKAMFLAKLKVATVVLLAVAVAGTGAGVAAYKSRPVESAAASDLQIKGTKRVPD